MQAKDRKLRARGFPYRWNTAGEVLGLIDDDMREPQISLERDRVVAMLIVQPGSIPKLDSQLIAI
jgi:hypothetical protein